MDLLVNVDVSDLDKAIRFYGHGFCFVQFLGRGYDEIADERRHDGTEREPHQGARSA